MNTSVFPKIIAHRGASGTAPENTLGAIQKALDLSSDWIEVDVHLSRDGEVVVIHDASLERTSNGKGLVAEHTLAELQTFDAGLWFGETFVGEKVPSLREVFELVGKQAGLLIEIKKGSKGLYPGIEQKILELIDRYQARELTILQSFEPEVIDNLYRLDPEMEHHKLVVWHGPLLPLYHDGKWRRGSIFADNRVRAINPSHRFLTKPFVKKAQKLGFKVFTYTVNEVKDLKRCLAFGVDGIITNYPERLLALKKDL